MNDLNAYEIAILKSASAALAKDTRDDLLPSPKVDGKCVPESVDVIARIRICGDVRVEADSLGAEHYASVPWADIAALLFSKVNDETREAVILQAIAGDVTSGQKLAAKQSVKALQSATTIDRRGAVKVLGGFVEVLDHAGDTRTLEDWDTDGPTLAA